MKYIFLPLSCFTPSSHLLFTDHSPLLSAGEKKPLSHWLGGVACVFGVYVCVRKRVTGRQIAAYSET